MKSGHLHVFYSGRRNVVALHEMFDVSGLFIGDLPYGEYIPDTEELHLLKKDAPQVYDTYWEVLCYFHICA